MEEKQYRVWWELHRRVAKGETLSEEEKDVYQAGLAKMEAEEWRDMVKSSAVFQSLQEKWRVLDERNQQLAEEEDELRALAAQLEQRYLELTGEKLFLGV